MGRAPAVSSALLVSIAPSCARVMKSLLGADVAMGQPKWAESASWWVPALCWTAELCPNVAERLEWSVLRAFFKSQKSDIGRAPAASFFQILHNRISRKEITRTELGTKSLHPSYSLQPTAALAN